MSICFFVIAPKKSLFTSPFQYVFWLSTLCLFAQLCRGSKPKLTTPLQLGTSTTRSPRHTAVVVLDVLRGREPRPLLAVMVRKLPRRRMTSRQLVSLFCHSSCLQVGRMDSIREYVGSFCTIAIHLFLVCIRCHDSLLFIVHCSVYMIRRRMSMRCVW